jgi:hypothetical protein
MKDPQSSPVRLVPLDLVPLVLFVNIVQEDLRNPTLGAIGDGGEFGWGCVGDCRIRYGWLEWS